MTTSYAKHFSTRQTPQSEPIPGSAQIPNSAGGYSFAVDKWARLERFLILGSEGGSYYASERKLTVENATAIQECLAEDGPRVIAKIVEISEAGRAPKNDPALFALAMAAGMGHAALVADALPKVARIGTHLFTFAEAVQNFRGWGRVLRRAVGDWYAKMPPERLAYQLAKYQQRNGWSHRDLLRLSHPATENPVSQSILRWAVGGKDALGAREIKRGEKVSTYPDVTEHFPAFLAAMEEAKTADTGRICALIRDRDLPRECIPTEKLNDVAVWEALLEKMPLTALVRNLGKMTAIGLVKPLSAATATVCANLADAEHIHKSRLHPIGVLLAAKTYAQGHGDKGKLSWDAVSQVNDALDGAFYAAFANVEPANKRTLLALDVSGSMGGGGIAGSSLTPREGSAAMALVTARTEPAYHVFGFSSQFVPLDITKGDRLTDAVRKISNLPFAGTDCALPMVYALQHKLDVDTFVVYTDSETWAGSIHPTQALRQYREKTGIPAKLIVVGMVSNGFSIADPNDAGMLDVVGFDASAPAVMADFARG